MTATEPPLPTWDLSDLYSGVDDPLLAKDMDRTSQKASGFAARYKGGIARADLDADDLRNAVEEYEDLLRLGQRPQAYAMLLYSTNTNDPARGALLQKSREFGSTIAADLVFFDIEIGQIPPDTYAKICQVEELAPYRRYLDHQRQLAVHNLSEPEERVLVETANARGNAFSRLFIEVHGRARYESVRDGDAATLTQSEILALLHDDDRDTRRAAARSLTTTLKANAHTCTFIYNTLLHEKHVLDRLRHYPEPEASRHLSNQLSGDVVDTMTDVCVANYGIVAEYYDLKRRLLGLDELSHYDRYAPISGAEREIPFSHARDLVLDAFAEFSPRLRQLAEPFFNECWIDAELADGKRGGAFCAGITPDLHPYVLMNYTGLPRDVMTLAHELGHGVHDVLASRNHLLDYRPVLPVAETASTFAEMLVFDRLLHSSIDSPRERLALVCNKVEDTFATVFRQVAMFHFEQQAHRARRERGELTTEALSDLWQENMQAMFGPSLRLGEEHACWWLYIPHIINTPFYVYAYAFGELLVLALYAQYQRLGESFVDRYFELLAAGGSSVPAELVQSMGFDIADRDFWQGGCDLIRQRVELAGQLEVS